MKLREAIQHAEDTQTAIGHFNMANIEGFWAIIKAAKALNTPVIIGLSEGERAFFGMRQAVTLIKQIREETGQSVFVNADHTYSIEKVKEAVEAGVDMVIFDGAKLSPEENTEKTKQAVQEAKRINPNVFVEGELGYIGSSSKILDDIPEGVSREEMTTSEQAKQFVEETGIDGFAPSVGNIHGMFREVNNPELNLERIKEIREAAGVPLVLHGGSGLTDDNFKGAIASGISVVHINTEIRRAYRSAMEESLKENPDEIAPYRIMKPSVEAMQEVIEERIKLFGNL